MGRKLKLLDLFSGIGGFSLGLERSKLKGAEIDGFETVAFCEIEEFPRRVLAKHWPSIPCYRDVRELTAATLAADGIAVDVICGGFPCQDISTAGNGAGLAGERSGLWSEIARLVGELRPRFILVENVAALLGRGLGSVLGDLAALGFDAEWHCIPASAVGAPHRRDRIWIVAYPSHSGSSCSGRESQRCSQIVKPSNGRGKNAAQMANSQSERCEETREHRERPTEWTACRRPILADAISLGRQGQGESFLASSQAQIIDRQTVDAFAGRVGDFWRVEPAVGRVAHGVPDRSHRLKGLGNAVVPQIPELIGNAILRSINLQHAETSAL